MCVRMAVGDRQPGAGATLPVPHSQPGSQGGTQLPGNKAAAFPACWGRGRSGELSHRLWEIFSLGSWQLLPAAHALLCLCL